MTVDTTGPHDRPRETATLRLATPNRESARVCRDSLLCAIGIRVSYVRIHDQRQRRRCQHPPSRPPYLQSQTASTSTFRRSERTVAARLLQRCAFALRNVVVSSSSSPAESACDLWCGSLSPRAPNDPILRMTQWPCVSLHPHRESVKRLSGDWSPRGTLSFGWTGVGLLFAWCGLNAASPAQWRLAQREGAAIRDHLGDRQKCSQ